MRKIDEGALRSENITNAGGLIHHCSNGMDALFHAWSVLFECIGGNDRCDRCLFYSLHSRIRCYIDHGYVQDLLCKL